MSKLSVVSKAVSALRGPAWRSLESHSLDTWNDFRRGTSLPWARMLGTTPEPPRKNPEAETSKVKALNPQQVEHRRHIRLLRKEYQNELRDIGAKKALSDLAKATEQKAAASAHRKAAKAAKAARQKAHQARVQSLAMEKEIERQDRFDRHGVVIMRQRERVLERFGLLRDQSSQWIGKETELDQAIKAALLRPEQLNIPQESGMTRGADAGPLGGKLDAF